MENRVTESYLLVFIWFSTYVRDLSNRLYDSYLNNQLLRCLFVVLICMNLVINCYICLNRKQNFLQSYVKA